MLTALSRYGRLAGVLVVALLLAIVAGCGGMASAPAADGGFAVAPQELAYAEPAMEAMDANSAGVASLTLDTRKIIANAFMELVVADTEETVNEISSLADDAGGYVSQANLYRNPYGDGSLLSGSLTLRIPAEQLETVRCSTGGAGVGSSVDESGQAGCYGPVQRCGSATAQPPCHGERAARIVGGGARPAERNVGGHPRRASRPNASAGRD